MRPGFRLEPGFGMRPGYGLGLGLYAKVALVPVAGLKSCRWAGRAQVLSRPGITYYLDGGHTPHSVKVCWELCSCIGTNN